MSVHPHGARRAVSFEYQDLYEKLIVESPIPPRRGKDEDEVKTVASTTFSIGNFDRDKTLQAVEDMIAMDDEASVAARNFIDALSAEETQDVDNVLKRKPKRKTSLWKRFVMRIYDGIYSINWRSVAFWTAYFILSAFAIIGLLWLVTPLLSEVSFGLDN